MRTPPGQVGHVYTVAFETTVCLAVVGVTATVTGTVAVRTPPGQVGQVYTVALETMVCLAAVGITYAVMFLYGDMTSGPCPGLKILLRVLFTDWGIGVVALLAVLNANLARVSMIVRVVPLMDLGVEIVFMLAFRGANLAKGYTMILVGCMVAVVVWFIDMVETTV